MPKVICGWDTCAYNNPDTGCECPDDVTLSNWDVEHTTLDGSTESSEFLLCDSYKAGDAS